MHVRVGERLAAFDQVARAVVLRLADDARNALPCALRFDYAQHLQARKEHVIGAAVLAGAWMRIRRKSGPFGDRLVLAARWPRAAFELEAFGVRSPAGLAELMIDELACGGFVELERFAGA
jgi:hypothetical protein